MSTDVWKVADHLDQGVGWIPFVSVESMFTPLLQQLPQSRKHLYQLGVLWV